MTIRRVALLVALVAGPAIGPLGGVVGCTLQRPAATAPGDGDLASALVRGVGGAGIGLEREQARCLIEQVRRTGGAGAVVGLRRHADLRGLHGDSGRVIARSFDRCVGTDFADAFGYEP